MARTKKKTGIKPKTKTLYFDLNKSLDQLQGYDSGEPTFQSSLVIHYHQMRKKPLKDLSAWDISRFIAQKFDLEYLVRLALPLLEVDPLLNAHDYPGDLLINVTYAGREFWQANPDLHERFMAIVEQARTILATQPVETYDVLEQVRKAVAELT